MRLIPICVLLATYFLLGAVANAQDFDPTINIGNQVDQNVSRTLETETGAPSYEKPKPPSGGVNENAVEYGYEQYSGFLIGTKPPKYWLQPKEVLLQETFNEKNSFLGTGVTDGYTSQLGMDFTSAYGTDIQPFLLYQHSSRDLIGTTTYRANSYGGSLGITQKLLPFRPVFFLNQPQARYNLGDTSKAFANTAVTRDGKLYAEDYYPNFDVNLGLNLNTASTNLSNLKKGAWVGSSQDSYGIAPSLIFGFYFKRPLKEAPFNLVPASVSIVPTYSDQMVNADNGTSSSAGIFSVQDRNTYIWVITENEHDGKDVGPTPLETIELTETNSLLHDTNQEPLTPSSTPIAYQNWAKFGFALAYRNKQVDDPKVEKKGIWIDSVKIEYTYEAFNAQYEAHNVVASVNIKF